MKTEQFFIIDQILHLSFIRKLYHFIWRRGPQVRVMQNTEKGNPFELRNGVYNIDCQLI